MTEKNQTNKQTNKQTKKARLSNGVSVKNPIYTGLVAKDFFATFN